MYKDFTSSAEAMRRERYRVAPVTTTRNGGSSLQTKVGQVLMRIGERLIDSPSARPRIKSASI